MDLAEVEITPPPVTDLILDPDTMYQNYGLTQPPVLATSTKALFNFTVAIVLLLGMDLFHGMEAILLGFRSKVKFGTLSMLFQTIGLASAISTYSLLAFHTQCWTGWEPWQTFCYLVSQHSASTTVIVGIANNSAVRYFVADDDQFAGRVATVLFYVGMVVGTPVWASLVTALCSLGGVLVIMSIVVSYLLKTTYSNWQGDPERNWVWDILRLVGV